MSSEKLFSREGRYSPAEVAQRLRRIADALERGSITLIDWDVPVPDKIEMELELKEESEDDGSTAYELEIEIEWTVPGGSSSAESEATDARDD
jgi:amphi-Trp domain-containing protein